MSDSEYGDYCQHPQSKVEQFEMERIWMEDLKLTHIPEGCPFLEGDWTFTIESNLKINKAMEYGKNDE
jgi:hypothetical protein